MYIEIMISRYMHHIVCVCVRMNVCLCVTSGKQYSCTLTTMCVYTDTSPVHA